MIGIVVPAHNEENHIGACLESLRRAARCPLLRGEDVLIVVALDACSDGTEAIARSQGAVTVSIDARNVGIARATGTIEALRRDARWLAFFAAMQCAAPSKSATGRSTASRFAGITKPLTATGTVTGTSMAPI